VRLFQIFLLFAPILTVFGNNTVFAENRGGKSSKSSENIKQSMFAGLHIDHRSADIALKIPDNFPLGIVSTIPLYDFALLKTVSVEFILPILTLAIFWCNWSVPMAKSSLYTIVTEAVRKILMQFIGLRNATIPRLRETGSYA